MIPRTLPLPFPRAAPTSPAPPPPHPHRNSWSVARCAAPTSPAPPHPHPHRNSWSVARCAAPTSPAPPHPHPHRNSWSAARSAAPAPHSTDITWPMVDREKLPIRQYISKKICSFFLAVLVPRMPVSMVRAWLLEPPQLILSYSLLIYFGNIHSRWFFSIPRQIHRKHGRHKNKSSRTQLLKSLTPRGYGAAKQVRPTFVLRYVLRRFSVSRFLKTE